MPNSQISYIDAKKNRKNVIVIGSGMAGLTSACLLAKDGFRVTVLEQNWLPGGCSSAYPRKGYIFESGATTLVGLSPNMPLHGVIQKTGIEIPHIKLDLPMRVYLPDGQVLNRYENLEDWILEAERVFGKTGQRPFWEYCYKVSRFVWNTSLQQTAFPPSNLKDLLAMAKSFRPQQLRFAPLAFQSMESLLKKYGLHEHKVFCDFVNEQLLITAQNYLSEVNVLFGATALCYTNYPNYYVPGGLIEMIKPMVQYIEDRRGEVTLRAPVVEVKKEGDTYSVKTEYRKNTQTFYADHIISSIPINNTLKVFDDKKISDKYQKRTLDSSKLNSAFQMGLVFKKSQQINCLHHQIHLQKPLPYTNSHSIFLSFSHPDDQIRCGADEVVASISTHVPDPAHNVINKEELEQIIIQELVSRGFFFKEDLIYYHSSTPKSWQKWTGRKWGFVGGYPQYLRTKPWQMLDARLDHQGAYICGDSTYPGQGIPGACLSGIIAYEKLKMDVRGEQVYEKVSEKVEKKKGLALLYRSL